MQKTKQFAIFLVLLFSLIFSFHNINGQNWSSVKQFKTTSSEYPTTMASDGNGNTYIAGHFLDSLRLGSKTLTSDGAADGFVAKLNSNDSTLWVRQIGGSNSQLINYLLTDDQGNCYVYGSYTGTAQFYNSGGSNYSSANASTENLFYLEYMPNGDIASAPNYFNNSNFNISAGDLAIGPNNAIYACANAEQVSSGAGIGIFFQTELNGNSFWSRSISNPRASKYIQTHGITVTSNRIIVTGYYFRAAYFTPDDSLTSGFNNGYLGVYDLNGNYLGYGSYSTSDPNDVAFGVELRSVNNIVYLRGGFEGTMLINNGSDTTLISDGGRDGFIEKYNASTGDFKWAVKAGGTKRDRFNTFIIDKQDHVHAAGFYSGTHQVGEYNIASAPQSDSNNLFYYHINENGQVEGMLKTEGPGIELPFSLSKGQQNKVKLIGRVDQNSRFGFHNLSTISQNSQDIFLANIGMNSISTRYESDSLCPGSEKTVRFIGNDAYETSNSFKAYLSDSSGSFSSQTEIGSIQSQNNFEIDSMQVAFPDSLKASGNYQIKVESTSPIDSSMAGSPLRIYEGPQVSSITGNNDVKPDQSYSYSVDGKQQSSFTWNVNNGSKVSGGDSSSIEVQWSRSDSGEIWVLETTENGCMSDTVSKTLNIDETDGIDYNPYINEMEMYPNPASKYLTLSMDLAEKTGLSIQIYNAQGKQFHKSLPKKVNGHFEKQVDVSNLEPGIYVVQIQTEDYQSKRKIIVR